MLIQRRQRRDDRQPSHQFRDQPILENVIRIGLGQQFGRVGLITAARRLPESHRPAPETLADDVVDTYECPATDEQDFAGVHLDVLLLGVFSSALWRHVRNGAFQHFQQCLLNPFP